MGKRIDLTGQKFGRLTVLEYSHFNHSACWKCLCDCGNIKTVRSDSLRNYTTTTCGCYQKTYKKIKMVGKRFGKLVVLKESYIDKHGQAFWECRCDCGVIKIINGGELRRCNVKSCGCHPPNNKLAKGEAAFNALFWQYIRTANKRDIPFTLSKENFRILTKQNCRYCGTSPSNIFKKRSGDYIYNGIDRVDNNKGYVKENVVACCKKCNLMKLDYSVKDFLAHITKINTIMVMK